MIDRLVADRRVVNAARIGAAFGMDPVAVLAGPREHFHIRLAAAHVVHRDRHPPKT